MAHGPKFKIPKYAQNTAFKKCTSVVLGGLPLYIYNRNWTLAHSNTSDSNWGLSPISTEAPMGKKNYLTEKRPSIGLESILMLRLPLFISLVYHGMFTVNVHWQQIGLILMLLPKIICGSIFSDLFIEGNWHPKATPPSQRDGHVHVARDGWKQIQPVKMEKGQVFGVSSGMKFTSFVLSSIIIEVKMATKPKRRRTPFASLNSPLRNLKPFSGFRESQELPVEKYPLAQRWHLWCPKYKHETFDIKY